MSMNSNDIRIAMLGGDLRQYAAAEELSKRGWKARAWGIPAMSDKNEGIEVFGNISDAVKGATVIALPLPVSTDGAVLNCPLSSPDEPVPLSFVESIIPDGAVVVGGRIPDELRIALEARGITVKDYFLSEEFQIHNAYITAEAALNIAMNNLDRNLSEAKIAITGYGRIAKHLVRLLKRFDADVTVVARKSSDLAWAYSSGCSVKRISTEGEREKNILALTKGYDVIYNTGPTRLFGRDFLVAVDRRTCIIDLASAPGGVDVCAAKALGSRVLWATSLPGKYAPVSAGRIIALCIDDILRNEVEL